MSAGTAPKRSLVARSSSCARSTRSSGSATSVGIGTNIIEMRLPNVPRCAGVRTDSGTMATSGSSASSSRSSSQVRSAAAHSVTTTCDLLARAGRRDGALTDVEVEVEVGILDPERQVDVERHGREPPAERRQQVDPLPDERQRSCTVSFPPGAVVGS
jgi:hypothetical protein